MATDDPQPEGNDLRRKVLTAALALVLWLATSAAAVLEVVLVRDIVVSLYLALQQSPSSELSLYNATAIGRLVTAAVGVIVAIFVIVSGEYHNKHLGERRSWRTFAWTAGVEFAILGLGLVVR